VLTVRRARAGLSPAFGFRGRPLREPTTTPTRTARDV